MTIEELRHFIEEKAHYFSQQEGYTVIHPELAEIMEDYAKALDPEEFERMARKMRVVRQREIERLNVENNAWRKEQESILERVDNEGRELQQLRDKISAIERQIKELTRLQQQAPLPPLRWYHSGYVVGLLAFSGIFFLYLGLLLQKRVAVSYVLVGLVCVILGMNVQREAASRKSPRTRQKRVTTEPLLEHKAKAEKVLSIKAVAFAEKKRTANESVQKLQLAVDHNISKIKLLHE